MPLPVAAALALLLGICSRSAAEVSITHHPRQATPNIDGSSRRVVADDDAHDGTAQAALPGDSRPGTRMLSLYSYARPAGLYRITWRVKVADNTADDVVLTASTDFGRGFAGGRLDLRASDFQTANVFQEFSCTAEKGEAGFFTIAALWHGGVEVRVDWIRVVSEKLYTEKELLDRGGAVELPDLWLLPAPPPLRVHLAKGLWWDFFGLSEAMAEVGGAITTTSYHSSAQGGRSLRGFPSNWQGFAAHNVIVLANVDAAALKARGRLLLEEYVINGGGLFVFGGPFAFDRGGYKNTAVGRLMPCESAPEGRVKAATAFVMAPASGSDDILPADLAWQLHPEVHYYHEVTAKPEARVLVTAAGRPMLIVWTVGRGRVAAFLGTAEGDPTADQLPFWDWGDMPRLVAAVLNWLAASPREDTVPPVSKKDLELLSALALPAPDDEDAERSRQLEDMLRRCRDKNFALELVAAIEPFAGTPSHRFIESVSRTIRPFVDADFAKLARALIDSGDPGKAALGVRMLGRCGLPEARESAEAFLADGMGALPSRPIGGGRELTGAADLVSGMHIDGNEQLQLAAVHALGDLGDPAALPALRRTTAAFSKKRQELSQVVQRYELNENIYQQSLAARCLLGDATAPEPFLDAIAGNAAVIDELQNSLDVMLVNQDDKRLLWLRKLAQRRLPVLHHRQAACMETLARMPASLAAEFAAAVVELDDPQLIPFAYAALSPTAARRSTAGTVAGLMPLIRDCQRPGLRRLPLRLAAEVHDPELEARIAAVLLELVADGNPASARYALRATPTLAPGLREKLVTAALQHPDPGIVALARRYQPLLGAPGP